MHDSRARTPTCPHDSRPARPRSLTSLQNHLSGVDAFFSMVPAEGLGQIFAFAAVFEWYEMTHKDGKWNGNNALQVTRRAEPPPPGPRTYKRTAHREAPVRCTRTAAHSPLQFGSPTPDPTPSIHRSPPHTVQGEIVPNINKWDILGFTEGKTEDDLKRVKLQELKNGRMAMIGTLGCVAAATIPGSVPLLTGSI